MKGPSSFLHIFNNIKRISSKNIKISERWVTALIMLAVYLTTYTIASTQYQ